MIAPYRLRLAPLAVAAIVITTAVPIEFRGGAGWSLQFDVGDLVQNVLLYVPLGAALSRRPLREVGSLACLLSLVIEATQLWGAERFASPLDVFNNTLGALAGAYAIRHFRRTRTLDPVSVRITRSSILTALLFLVLIVAWWSTPTRPTDLSNWDQSFPLLMGNERTGSRDWKGTIESLQLFDTVLSRAQIASESGVRASYIPPLYSWSGPIKLHGGPAVRLPDDVASRFARAARAGNQFTILVTFATADDGQTGPARILSFSEDTLHRNFDIGQDGRRIVLRIRTPSTGLNGGLLRATSRDVLHDGRPVQVAAAYDGTYARLYVNGILEARRNLSESPMCWGQPFCDRTSGTVWALAAGMLSLIAFGLVPVRTASGTWSVAAAAATMIIVVAAVLPVAPLLTESFGMWPLITYISSASVALAKVSLVREADALSSPPRGVDTSRGTA